MIIADVSFGHEQATGAALVAAGFGGAIGYVSDYLAGGKNLPAARLADWREHGLLVALVGEDTSLDMLDGYGGGLRRGLVFADQARAIGYDLDNCVLFAAADFNTQPDQYQVCDRFMAGFAEHIPHPGLYGNAGLIDHQVSEHLAEYGWQSNSASFSYGPSPHARLLQRYNDPRARGLPIDVNDVTTFPLRFMGEPTMSDTTAQQVGEIHTMLTRLSFGLDDGHPMPYTERGELLHLVRSIAGNAHTAAANVPPSPAAIAAAIAPAIASAGVSPSDLARALVDLAAAGASSSSTSTAAAA